MMSDFHKDLLRSLINTWTVQQIEDYIVSLETRIKTGREEIAYLRELVKHKTRKVVDNGPRDGR